jgi:hypothetical protein
MIIILTCLSLFLSGTARSLVGAGCLSRWSTYPFVALASAFVGLIPILDSLDIVSIVCMMWVVLVASLNLSMGYTRWESWWWMTLRFGLPSIVLVSPILYLNQNILVLLYPLASLIVGSIYPYRQWLFDYLKFREQVVQIPLTQVKLDWDSARMMEFLVGCIVLGGLSLVTYS